MSLSRGRAQRIRPSSSRTQATVSITTGTVPVQSWTRMADITRPSRSEPSEMGCWTDWRVEVGGGRQVADVRLLRDDRGLEHRDGRAAGEGRGAGRKPATQRLPPGRARARGGSRLDD